MELLLNYRDLKIVPLDKLPQKDEIKDVPLDNLVNIYNLFMRMTEICTAENGIGLSAVQLGLPFNFFIVKGDQKSKLMIPNEYGCFINCGLDVLPEREISLEGCLSIRSENGRQRHFQVERHKKVLLSGLILDKDRLQLKEIKNVELEGLESIVFQHEMDHSKGILISDIGKEVFLYR